MRRYLSSVFILLAVVGFSQPNITALEYYIDDDPGVGMATPVTITPSTDIDMTFTVPVSGMGLSEGFHLLVVRAKDDDDNWSMYEKRTFYIQADVGVTPPPAADINLLEFFVDTDPGIGSATSISHSGSSIDVNELLDVGVLADGFHIIGVRARNTDGRWGFAEYRTFYVQNISGGPGPTPADITDLEYFFDTDPGVGASPNTISITQGQTIDITELISSSGLADGFHTLSIRAKNADDLWGMYENRIFYVQNTGGTTPVNSPIVALEYFINTDPGVGSGIQVPISPSTTLVDISSIMLDLGASYPIGDHEIWIRAQNEDGNWGHRESFTFTIDGDCPIADFDIASACVGETINLTDISTGILGPASYRWYADGELIDNTVGDITHSFDSPGSHTLSLALENGTMCTDSIGYDIEIKAKPFVSFSADPVVIGNITQFEVVQFNVAAGSTWEWDFDNDGMPDDNTEGNTSFTFSASGDFLVTLTVFDGEGCGTDTFSKTVTVNSSGGGSPTADFNASVNCAGLVSSFINLSENIPPGSTYSWDLDGDGTEDSDTSGDVEFTYPGAGTYTVELTISSPSDGDFTTSEEVTIEVQPVADFSVGTACVGELVSITDNSTSGSSSTYSWDFDGDGVEDSNVAGDETFTFDESGSYSVSLLIDQGNGCFDFVTKNVTVDDPSEPNFDFTYTTSGRVEAVVQFENLSSGSTEFSWDFGDGSTSTDTNPTHTYTDYSSQSFEVCLTTVNQCLEVEYCETLSLTVTGVQDLIEAGISIYPNPSNGTFFLDFTNSDLGQYTIRIIDVSGKVLSLSELNNQRNVSSLKEINISQPGSYFIHVSSEHFVGHQKLLIR